MSKALLIDAKAQEVREVEYSCLEDLQALVGGYIEVLFKYAPTQDVCFVDEDGMHKPQTGGFFVRGRDIPTVGNGVVVGRERLNRKGDVIRTEDVALTIDELRSWVRFVTRAQIDSWGKANASDPWVTITAYDDDGNCLGSKVLARVGSVFGAIPKVKVEE